jgi:hypothetical protein
MRKKQRFFIGLALQHTPSSCLWCERELEKSYYRKLVFIAQVLNALLFLLSFRTDTVSFTDLDQGIKMINFESIFDYFYSQCHF